MSLDGKIKSVKNDFLADLDDFQTQNTDIENIRQKYLGRNGLVAVLFKSLGSAFIKYNYFTEFWSYCYMGAPCNCCRSEA